MAKEFIDKALKILGENPANRTSLIELERNLHQLVPFVGAGLSVEFGYPMWGQFLQQSANDFGIGPKVATLLGQYQYEEAAEELASILPRRFEGLIGNTFNYSRLSRPLDKGAVRHIPRIARRPVLTTNFDRVLELAFRDAGRDIEAFPGSRIQQASHAVQLNEQVLLKLHGDYNDSASRVLTLSEYEREYGSRNPEQVDFHKPLPIVLRQALGAGPFLFLGCSLKTDRTTRVLKAVAAELKNIVHFALLPDSEDTPERNNELDSWSIRPLFFPQGRYEKIEEFLACIADFVPAASDSKRPIPPPPPPDFVPRPVEFNDAKAKLLQVHSSPTVALSTALAGAGGYGKTTLAQALCFDLEIKKAYADGMYWIELGQTPRILEELGRLYKELTGAVPPTADANQAAELIAKALANRSVLLVIDDAWQVAHLKPFLDASPRCTRLITTRNVDILDPNVDLVRVDEMLIDQSVEVLLRGWSERPAQMQPVRDLALRLGRWALLLNLANGAIRTERRRRGATIDSALAEVTLSYQRQGLKAFDASNPAQRNDAAAKSIELSVALLDEAERQRYLELGIFPEDTNVPTGVAAELWGIGFEEAKKLLLSYDDLSLLKYFADDQTFRLHDVLYDWLRRRGAAAAVHARLIDAWPDPLNLPHPYAWQWMSWHLLQAGRREQLHTLLFSFPWLQKKLEVSDVVGLTNDFDVALASEKPEPDPPGEAIHVPPWRRVEWTKKSNSHPKLREENDPDEPLRLLQGALRLSAHVLAGDVTQLAGQLFGRLPHDYSSQVQKVLGQADRSQVGVWLKPKLSSLSCPGGTLVRTLAGHGHEVLAVAVTPDGKQAVSGSSDKTLKVWDLESGLPLRTLEGHRYRVSAVAVTPDGKLAISGSSDNTTASDRPVPFSDGLKVWDLESGRLVRTIDGHKYAVNAVAVTPDGKQAVSASGDKTLKVWDLESGRPLRTIDGHEYVSAVAVTPDGALAIFGSGDATLRVWNLKAGEELGTLHGHTSGVHGVAITPDGERVVSASADQTLKVWDVASGRVVRTLHGHTSGVYGVAITPDGKYAVSASGDKTLKFWDLESGRTLRTIEGHSKFICAVAATPDGKHAISASGDKTLKVWNLKSEEEVRKIRGHKGAVTAVATTPDASRAISSSDDGTLKVWDLKSAQELRTLARQEDYVMALAMMPDGTRGISGSRPLNRHQAPRIKVWDLKSGTEVRTIGGHTYGITTLAVTPDGTLLISGSAHQPLQVWDLEKGHRVLTLGSDEWITTVAVAPDGVQAISGSYDGRVKVWELRKGKLLTQHDHGGVVLAVAVTPEGERAVSTSWGPSDGWHSPKVWDPTEGKELQTLRGHSDTVNAVVLTPDGKQAVSTSSDHTLRVWDLASGAMIAVFTADAAVTRCAVARNEDGLTIAAGDESGVVHFLTLEMPRRGDKTP